MIAFAVAAPIQWISTAVKRLNSPTVADWAEAAFWTDWYTLAGAGVGAAVAYFTRPHEREDAPCRPASSTHRRE